MMPRVEIVWHDAMTLDEVKLEDVASMGICRRHVCGWLVREGEDGLVVALDETRYQDGTVEYSHAYFVPREYMVSISRW